MIYDLSTTEIDYSTKSNREEGFCVGKTYTALESNAFDMKEEKENSSTEEIVISSDSEDATEEENNAVNTAAAMQSNLPSFTIMLKQYNVQKPFALNMPRRFPKDNPSIKKKRIYQTSRFIW